MLHIRQALSLSDISTTVATDLDPSVVVGHEPRAATSWIGSRPIAGLAAGCLALGILVAPALVRADDIDTEEAQKRRKEQMQKEAQEDAKRIEDAAKAEAKKMPTSSNNSSVDSSSSAGTCSIAGGDGALVGLAALGLVLGSGAALRRRRRASMGSTAALVLALATTWGGAGVAHADVPPPEGYVEQCTVEKQEAETGHKCESCGDAYHGDRDACERRFAGTSMQRQCQTSGASTWDEVWCDPSTSAPKSEGKAAGSSTTSGEAPPKTGGCRCDIDPASPDGNRVGWLGLAAFAAACLGGYALRRRRVTAA